MLSKMYGLKKREQPHWTQIKIRTKDESFRDPELEKIAKRIRQYQEEESLGIFQSQGMRDVLTKSLENHEHSGRVRGHSQFVKQST